MALNSNFCKFGQINCLNLFTVTWSRSIRVAHTGRQRRTIYKQELQNCLKKRRNMNGIGIGNGKGQFLLALSIVALYLFHLSSNRQKKKKKKNIPFAKSIAILQNYFVSFLLQFYWILMGNQVSFNHVERIDIRHHQFADA